MKRETLLASGVAFVIGAMLLAAALGPGVLAEPDDEYVQRSSIHLQEGDGTIRVLSVPGDTVTLQLDSRLAHSGGPANNVTLEVRAIDSESGLLVDQSERTVDSITGDRTVSVLSNVTVERAGGYRIETIVYQDGEKVDAGHTEISGVGSLTPDYARSDVQFQRYESVGDGFGAVATRIRTTSGDRAALNVSADLVNAGDSRSEDVTVRLRARQAESNVIADEARVSAGSIGPGVTEPASAELIVPDGYNYWIDAILLADGVVVDTTTSAANLLPNETLTGNDESDRTQFSTGDFQQETDSPFADDGADAPTPTETAAGGPGFGPILALAAMVGAALLLARRSTNE